MQIWFKIDLTQSHLRTSFSDFFYRFSFSFNRDETSSFAHPVLITQTNFVYFVQREIGSF
jgi:hypothetical protein